MEYYASYYKCALQVNPYRYSLFRGKEQMKENDYNNMILKKCIDNKISVVGLADHGCVDSSESLRQLLISNKIMVFPGFEISSAEKIHMVCLFPPDKTTSELNRYLGVLGMGTVVNGNETSTMTCLDIADKINQLNGFWYAAHITGDNGILKLGKLNSIWKDNRLVAAQIPNSRENIDPCYLNIIKNKEPTYKREHMLALINACDIEKPEDLDKETSVVLVKMTTPSFKNFVVAFKDPESRVQLYSELEKNYQSCIKSISVFGGYLDGIKFDLSDNLTAIIGGRGTGKSTIINFIRYALNLPMEKDLQKAHNSMIDTNLGSLGRIELDVISNTQFNKSFKIVRRYKQNPVILDENGKVSSLSIEDIMPSIEIYGQNEIMDAISNPQKINKIVQRLFSIDKSIEIKRDDAYTKLLKNGEELNRLNRELKICLEDVGDLPALNEKLKFYNEAGLVDKLTVIKKLATEEGQFESFYKNLPKDNVDFSEVTILESDNEELNKLSIASKEYNNKIKMLKNEYKEAVTNLNKVYKCQKESWINKKSQYDQEIKDSLKQIEGIQDKSSSDIVNDYSNLIKKIEVATPIQQKIETISSNKDVLLNERKTIIEDYKVACDEYDLKINKLLKKINTKKLTGRCRLSVKFRQQKNKLIESLKKLDGIGDKSLAGILLFEDFDVFTFVEDVKGGVSIIKEKYSLNQSTAEKICENLSEENLRDIEELQLENIIQIELEVNGQYKKLENLSKGQQCTAILNILLLDNKDPLIIDQPEDNLDNAFIAENLIETIRINKIRRQYIFATHNANIPVFGDAELIVAMEETDNQGKISENGIGSIDSEGVRNRVIQILEGGPEAFRMREKKYGIS